MNELSRRETELVETIRDTDGQVAQVDRRLQMLPTVDADQSHEQFESVPTELIASLGETRAALLSSRKLFKELLSETHSARTGQRIRDVDTSDGGRLLVGLINVKGDQDQAAQDISNISARNRGMGIVGIAEGVDINAFFNSKP